MAGIQAERKRVKDRYIERDGKEDKSVDRKIKTDIGSLAGLASKPRSRQAEWQLNRKTAKH